MGLLDSFLSLFLRFLLDILDWLPDPTARLNIVFSPLEGFLPDPVVIGIKWTIFLGAILLAVILGLKLYIDRNKMVIRAFKDTIEDARFDGSRVAVGLMKQLQEIRSVHNESATTAVGEVIDPSELQLISENVGNKVSAILVNFVGVGVLLTVAGWVWPRLELSGTMRLEESTFQLDCTLTTRGYQTVFKVEVDYCTGPGPEFELSANLAYWLMVVRSPATTTQKHDNIGLQTRNWEALKAHTEALRLWGGPGFKNKTSDDLKKVGSKLKESCHYDADYALAHYNLGVLTYLPKGNPGANEEARDHFLKATELAKKSNNTRTEGLAWIGVSKCYSQDVHRFGRTDTDMAAKARKAAAEAEDLLPGDPGALHAYAFAWHCTDDLRDIKRARPIYEDIIKEYPDKYANVYNNLGYILMVGGELLQAEENSKAEAEDWWKQAECHMKKTLSLDAKGTVVHRYALANLGNLHRLRGNFEEALIFYLKALDDNPNYTEGLNELARLYFDQDDMIQGLRYHKRALRTLKKPTTDEDHQKLKLMREVKDILDKKGRPAEGQLRSRSQVAIAKAVDRLYKKARREKARRKTWLADLSQILEPCAASSPTVRRVAAELIATSNELETQNRRAG